MARERRVIEHPGAGYKKKQSCAITAGFETRVVFESLQV